MTAKSERDKIAARIRALLSKTVENGCTEAEAISAARIAAELLGRYNMTVDEAQMRESEFKRHTEQHTDFVGDRLWKVAAAISDLTGARYWTSGIGIHPVEINFFGFDHEVDVARYLLDICARAMRWEHGKLLYRHRLLRASKQRQKIIPYLDGMADTLARRIRAIKPPEPTGKGLIVLRNALIDAAMPVETQQRRKAASRNLDMDYAHGVSAGAKVHLNPGIKTGAAETRQITKGI